VLSLAADETFGPLLRLAGIGGEVNLRFLRFDGFGLMHEIKYNATNGLIDRCSSTPSYSIYNRPTSLLLVNFIANLI
jgi:hypothetical protein